MEEIGKEEKVKFLTKLQDQVRSKIEHEILSLKQEKEEDAEKKVHSNIRIDVENFLKNKKDELKTILHEIKSVKKKEEYIKKIGFISDSYIEYFKAEKITKDLLNNCLIKITPSTIASFLGKQHTEKTADKSQHRTQDFYSVYLGYCGWGEFIISIEKEINPREKKIAKKVFFYPIIFIISIVGILLWNYDFLSPSVNNNTSKEIPISEFKEKQIQSFSTPSPKDSLRILITRFGNDNTFGKAIKNRIDRIVEREHLPIKAIYLNKISFTNPLKRETTLFIEKQNIDLLIYGNPSSFHTDQYYFYYEVSEEFHESLSEFEKNKIENRLPVKVTDVYDVFEKKRDVFFEESFDDWLKGINSYKSQNGKNFYINPKLPSKIKAIKLYDKSTLYNFDENDNYKYLKEAFKLDPNNTTIIKSLCARFYSYDIDNNHNNIYCDLLTQKSPTANNYLLKGIQKQQFLIKKKQTNSKNFKDNFKNFTHAISLEPKNPKIYLSILSYQHFNDLNYDLTKEYIGFYKTIKNDSIIENYINQSIKYASEELSYHRFFYGRKLDSVVSTKTLAKAYDAKAHFFLEIRKLKDTLKSLEYLKNAYKYNPDHLKYIDKILTIYKIRKDTIKILNLLNEVIKNNPDIYFSHEYKAFHLKSIGLIDSSSQTLKKLLKKTNSTGTKEILRSHYTSLKGYNNAIQALKYSEYFMEKDPSTFNTYFYMIKALFRIREYKSTYNGELIDDLILKYQKKIFVLNKWRINNSYSHLFITEVEKNDKYYNFFLRMIDSALYNNPSTSKKAYQYKARLYLQKNNHIDAINVYKEAIDKKVDDLYFTPLLVKLLLKCGDTLEAQKYL